jgi:purine-nucleoside phosphorylase
VQVIVCAGNIETFPFATPVGIGLVQSAINTTRLCLMTPPKELVFVGTAGSYGNHEIFDIVTSSKGCNVENGFFENKSYTPLDNVIAANENPDEPLINSSNYITSDTASAKAFLRRSIALENMEFYSILSVAKEFNLPVKGIFIVTNYCFEDAHKEFVANHEEAMQRLSEFVRVNLF